MLVPGEEAAAGRLVPGTERLVGAEEGMTLQLGLMVALV